MRQEINLLQESLFDKKVPLRAQRMLILFGLTLVFLLLISLGLLWRQHRLDANLVRLKTEKNRLTTQLAACQRENPARQKDPHLETELENLRRQRKGRQPLMAYFDSLEPEQIQGFSAPLEKLALHPFPNVWLQQLRLNPAKKYLQLGGTATSPDQIPAYFVHLQTYQIFAGQNFANLQLERTQQDSDLIHFQLESKVDSADEH